MRQGTELRRKRRAAIRLAPLVLLVAWLLAACSGSDGLNSGPSPSALNRVDYGVALSACLQKHGVIAERDHGSYSFNPGPGQTYDDVDEIRKGCEATLGPKPAANYSRDEADHLFDLWVSAADCYRAHGYDTSPPPSRAAFVDALMQGQPPIWWPANELSANPSNGLAAIEALTDVCPDWDGP